jgi:hypothetical protein
MYVHGIVMTATLEEVAGNADLIELHLVVQGVGPGQPRRIVVPMDLLIAQPEIEPESVVGHAFEAEVQQDGPKRWVAETISFAARRILRPE